jgi:hypothetical protein
MSIKKARDVTMVNGFVAKSISHGRDTPGLGARAEPDNVIPSSAQASKDMHTDEAPGA